MRILIALALSATLFQLSGCVVDGVEAAQVRPVESMRAGTSVGHEMHKMFADEKVRAKPAELPAQF